MADKDEGVIDEEDRHESRFLNDAEILGTPNPDMDELLRRNCTFLDGQMYGQYDKRNTQDGHWKPINLPWSKMIEGFAATPNTPAFGLSRHQASKNKAGKAIVLGDSIDGARKAKAMTTMYALGLDIDSGARLGAVVQMIEDLGLFATIYTSHSHGKSGLELKRDDILRKMEKTGTLTENDVQVYLRDHSKERFDEAFVAQVKIVDEKHQTKDGTKVVCSTPPLDKFRVIFPLIEPVKIIDLAGSHDEALTIWEDKITGLAQNVLGVHFDTSCTDPSRLFYTARHPKGAEFDCVIIEGRPISFGEIEPFSKLQYARTRTAPANAYSAAGEDQDKNKAPRCHMPSGASLNEWHYKAKDRFLMADMIEQTAPEYIRKASSESAGRVHIECPNEHRHSSEGGTATMAMNFDANTEYGVWTIFCKHDACQGVHKLEFLEEMLRQQWFDEGELFNEDYLLPPSDEVLDENDGIDPLAETRDGKALEAETGTTADDIAKDAVERWNKDTTEEEIHKHMTTRLAAKSDQSVINKDKEIIASLSSFNRTQINKIIRKIEITVAKRENNKELSKLDGKSMNVEEDFFKQTEYVVKAFRDRSNNPTVFHCGGGLVRTEYDDGIARSTEVTKDKLRNEIGWIAPFHREYGAPPNVRAKNVAPPLDVRDWIYAEPYVDNFPPLTSVQTTPYFATSGKLISKPGYHRDAKTVLDLPENMKGIDVPTTPTQDEIDAALLLLTEEVFGDFPVGGADREGLISAYHYEVINPSYANLIGLVLLPFMRQMVDGPTPGHVLEKPQPRTGASLLADVVSIIATGHPVSAMSMPGNRDEMSKTLTTVLRGGQNIVCFDNINTGVDSGELASAMTARTYQARLLGATALVNVPVECVWVMTANNLEMSEEMAERCNLIELNANTPKPGQREGFRHKDILGYVRTNRPAIVRACLILIQNWIAKGKPDGDGKLGGYEAWVRAVGGIVSAAGIKGFMGNRDRFVDRVSTGEAQSGVQMLMNRLSDYPDGQIIRAGSTKTPQGVKLGEGHEVVSLLDVLNETDEESGDRIYLEKWGLIDGDYTNPASAGSQFRKLERMPFDCLDSKGRTWRVTIQEASDTARKPYYIMMKKPFDADPD